MALSETKCSLPLDQGGAEEGWGSLTRLPRKHEHIAQKACLQPLVWEQKVRDCRGEVERTFKVLMSNAQETAARVGISAGLGRRSGDRNHRTIWVYGPVSSQVQ